MVGASDRTALRSRGRAAAARRRPDGDGRRRAALGAARPLRRARPAERPLAVAPGSGLRSRAMMPRRAWHRGLFVAAGVYNIGWGIWSALDPQWLMRFTGMPPLNQPA